MVRALSRTNISTDLNFITADIIGKDIYMKLKVGETMLYDCKCHTCGKIQEIVRKIDDRNNTPDCCGHRMIRFASQINVHGDLNFVTADITGKDVHITSRKQHDELCRVNHVAPVGIKGEF